ncbi:MAG: AMP-binding protein [bacterium]|nr:MAG: AMP-binding protein [bacterium]
MTGETLTDCFDRSFSTWGDKTAVTFFRDGRVETQISYSDLAGDSIRFASGFRDMGVGKGDRVILYLEKSLSFVVSYLALQRVGAIAVPLNPGFKETEMEYLMADADASLILCGPDQEKTIRHIDPGMRILTVDPDRPYQDQDPFPVGPVGDPRVDLEADDPGLIIYTSGTTGDPKGAVLTQGNLVHDARNVIDIWEITASDVLCHALPLFHVHGLCFALQTALMSGVHVVMLDRFVPKTVIDHLARKGGDHACSVFMAVPQMYAKLMAWLGERRPDFSHIRLWTSGSAPLLVEDFARIKEFFGKEPVEREGMSETGMNFSNPYRGVRKPGTIGLPLPGLEARIVDPETLEDVAPGEEGELWLKGPSITPGYWRKPRETAEAFVDGWFRSGDLGKVDEDGYYYITDRLKHIIISGGENISPKEIQGVINQLPGVVESAVVGLPDEEWGEKVVAAVVPPAGTRVTADAVKAHCRVHLHDWKCPKEILFVDHLPRNTMGKVLNEAVKELFSRGEKGQRDEG